MRFQFSFDEIDCLSRITDKATLSDRVFTCTGRSVVTFQAATLEDNAEILFRISELLAILDTLACAQTTGTPDIYFDFQFERRIIFRIKDQLIQALDREQNLSIVDEFSVDDIKRSLLDIEHFINTEIRPHSAFVARYLLDREAL